MILVAKSYEGLEKVGEPYLKSGRSYIKVLTKTGQEKEVRVYTEKEYLKMYPAAVPTRSHGPQMNCLGFKDQDDYIIYFIGNIIKNNPWFEERTCMRYHRVWGWYVVDKTYPAELPENVFPCKLPWTAIGNNDGYLKSEEELMKIVKKISKEEIVRVGK